MKIALLTNAHKSSGVGQYAFALKKGLVSDSAYDTEEFRFKSTGVIRESKNVAIFKPWPGVLGTKSIGWIRGGWAVKNSLQQFDLIHATNQTLSFIKPRKPFVVTVHDVIELTNPQDKKAALLNTYLTSGITKASHIIAVSNYTKKAILDYFSIPENKVTVIHNGIDTAIFHPIGDFRSTIGYQTLRQELKLGDHHPIVLYVGSEQPRKNVPTIVQAFAKLKERRPDALFIKVGQAGLPAGRQELLQIIDKYNLRAATRIINEVSARRLNELYNAADVFMYPSSHEGFGMPVLEAMAAGTPVVCSNATSLPEVVGQAALTANPDDIDAFTNHLLQITQDPLLKKQLIEKGLSQAKKFSWEEAVKKTKQVYEIVFHQDF